MVNTMVSCLPCGAVVLIIGGLILIWWYLRYRDELTGKDKQSKGREK